MKIRLTVEYPYQGTLTMASDIVDNETGHWLDGAITVRDFMDHLGRFPADMVKVEAVPEGHMGDAPSLTLHAALDAVLYAAQRHGDQSTPEHEAGDLQGVLREAWDAMSVEQKVAFVQRPVVQDIVECWAPDKLGALKPWVPEQAKPAVELSWPEKPTSLQVDWYATRYGTSMRAANKALRGEFVIATMQLVQNRAKIGEGTPHELIERLTAAVTVAFEEIS